MPLYGTNHSKLVQDDAPFFVTLAELDTWGTQVPQALSGVLPYVERKLSLEGSASQGKLLVCHDYKGGYTESPSAQSYTFNFWPYCDIFVYFSHHRVTVPPSGWITAAHRHGVKMLGTLIFEGADEADCLRLLVGRLPQSKSGPLQAPQSRTIPVSPHYARLLAVLARQRGFDGYLLNFECPLQGSTEQTRALSAWITILESELRREVGPHSEVVWYDSVIIDGRLRWQDRLDSVNLPFFLPATGFFTNYTWPPQLPPLTAQYFLSIDPQHLEHPWPKRLQDIYVGVDVWGRGSHGGGGFGSYKAINHIDPQFLGLSVALFGQAWTWETEQDKEGFTWETWWAYERKLWLGPVRPDDVVRIPEPPPNELPCQHGPFAPITSFFTRKPPPDPLDISFYTSFSPGVGQAWFVEGTKMMESPSGWTDLQKTTSIGDLAWPRPAIASELGEWEGGTPVASVALCMDDAWMGGSSLRLDIALPKNESTETHTEPQPTFHYIWVPIQTLSLTAQQSYDVKLVYKMLPHTGAEVDLGLSAKALVASDDSEDVELTELSMDQATSSIGGWAHLALRGRVKRSTPHNTVALGLFVGIAREDSSTASNLSILLGQLSAFPSPSSTTTSIPQPQILWADYEKHIESGAGVLTWETAYSLPTATSFPITSIEDPQPAWVIDPHIQSFLYFNIYAEIDSGGQTKAFFLGTSGLDGRGTRFFVDSACLHPELVGLKKMRFSIQGVTDRGEVLSRERSVFVEVDIPQHDEAVST